MARLGEEVCRVFEVNGGHISEVTNEAIELAKKENRPISFVFNSVIVTVEADSDPEMIVLGYMDQFFGEVDSDEEF